MDRFADFILTPIALFSGRSLAVGIALSILGAALLLWLLTLVPAERRFLGPLRQIARALRVLRGKEIAPEAAFAEADTLFAATDLALAWRRYRSRVEFEDGQAMSYADPGDFFALVYLPGHGYPKWSATLAGVFLTVGLFFTFVGLSAALLQLGGDGHDSLSPAQLKRAVEGILAVSSVKFITSIAGILAYIFWSVVARQQSGNPGPGRGRPPAGNPRAFDLCRAGNAAAPAIAAGGVPNAQFGALAANLSARLDAAFSKMSQTLSDGAASAFTPLRDELAAMSARVGRPTQGWRRARARPSAPYGRTASAGISTPSARKSAALLGALDALPKNSPRSSAVLAARSDAAPRK